MNLFNSWKFYIIIYLIVSVVFNQGYKLITNKVTNDGALTILIQIISSGICIILIPLFDFKFPTDIKVYIFLEFFRRNSLTLYENGCIISFWKPIKFSGGSICLI